MKVKLKTKDGEFIECEVTNLSVQVGKSTFDEYGELIKTFRILESDDSVVILKSFDSENITIEPMCSNEIKIS